MTTGQQVDLTPLIEHIGQSEILAQALSSDSPTPFSDALLAPGQTVDTLSDGTHGQTSQFLLEKYHYSQFGWQFGTFPSFEDMQVRFHQDLVVHIYFLLVELEYGRFLTPPFLPSREELTALPILELARLATDVVYQLESLGYGGSGSAWNELRIAQSYLLAVEQDRIAAILSGWNPEEERRLLDTLQSEINLMPDAVYGIPTSHVRANFQLFHGHMEGRFQLLFAMQLQIDQTAALESNQFRYPLIDLVMETGGWHEDGYIDAEQENRLANVDTETLLRMADEATAEYASRSRYRDFTDVRERYIVHVYGAGDPEAALGIALFVASFVPIIGTAIGVATTLDAIRRGQGGEAALNGLSLVIPLIGPAVRRMRGLITTGEAVAEYASELTGLRTAADQLDNASRALARDFPQLRALDEVGDARRLLSGNNLARLTNITDNLAFSVPGSTALDQIANMLGRDSFEQFFATLTNDEIRLLLSREFNSDELREFMRGRNFVYRESGWDPTDFRSNSVELYQSTYHILDQGEYSRIIRTNNEGSCAPTSLASLLGLNLNDGTALSEIARVTRFTRYTISEFINKITGRPTRFSIGITIDDAANGLRRLGRNVDQFSGNNLLSFDNLASEVQRGTPIYVSMRVPSGNHAMIVYEITDTHVIMGDPDGGVVRSVPRADFEAAYTGRAIIIRP